LIVHRHGGSSFSEIPLPALHWWKESRAASDKLQQPAQFSRFECPASADSIPVTKIEQTANPAGTNAL
jgi:hypothetical protein